MIFNVLKLCYSDKPGRLFASFLLYASACFCETFWGLRVLILLGFIDGGASQRINATVQCCYSTPAPTARKCCRTPSSIAHTTMGRSGGGNTKVMAANAKKAEAQAQKDAQKAKEQEKKDAAAWASAFLAFAAITLVLPPPDRPMVVCAKACGCSTMLDGVRQHLACVR